MGPGLGQRVSVICLERPGKLAAQVEQAGARVVCLDKPPGRHPGLIGKVAAALRDLGTDVVHTHQIGALYYAGPASRDADIKLVVHTEHINQISKHKGSGKRLKTRLLWWLAGRHASRFFCVSEDIGLEVRAFGVLPQRKVRVVLNGIDTARFRSRELAAEVRREFEIPPDARVVGTIGRLNEVKCQDLLIRSFGRVRGRDARARLLIVGDGPKRADLDRLVGELGLSGSVHFAGYQAHPERYLQAMDVFALTSRAEGLPLAILEAWAAGLPVVSTRVGGIPMVLEDGRTGLLLDSGDEDALAASLIRLTGDEDLRRRLGEAGRARAEADFDTRRMAGDYHRHYLELLEARGTSVRCAS
jgi:glycosyltransferase involved in cell wall biosynthesis